MANGDGKQPESVPQSEMSGSIITPNWLRGTRAAKVELRSMELFERTKSRAR